MSVWSQDFYLFYFFLHTIICTDACATFSYIFSYWQKKALSLKSGPFTATGTFPLTPNYDNWPRKSFQFLKIYRLFKETVSNSVSI